MDIKERRKIIKQWMVQCDQHDQEVERRAKIRDEAYQLYHAGQISSNELDEIERQYRYPEPPTYPPELLNMRCGAKNRQGVPCKIKNVYLPSGRCKFHGGLSTGPRTADGKAKSALNLSLKMQTP